MATCTALSSYEMYWYPWDDKRVDSWVRPMPEHDYVFNLRHNPMTTYLYKMHQEDLAKQFGRCIVCPITIRKLSIFWESVPMNPYSATAVFLISNTATKDSAGSPSLKMSILRPLCMTGRSMISGMPTIALIIHIMNYIIYFTRPA